MKWLKKFELFKESKTYSDKSLITEICVSMLLINNDFLSNILDKGIRGRYNENSQVFVTDLKNLLLAKNRLNLGKFEDNKCVVDTELSKVNELFSEVKFDIEKDWKMLVDSRNIARCIIDKIIPDDKLDSDRVRNIFWIANNKDDDHKEDIVVELTDGKQYSFFLNKNLSNQKSASFNTFAEDLIGEDLQLLFSEQYLPKWDKLTQEWIRIIYDNANKNIQAHIEKFIDPKRIESIGYFDYFDIRHSDVRFKHLGEFMKDFNKNILKFQDLMLEIWKNRDSCFMDTERVYQEWMECKVVILNSKILESLLTSSLKSKFSDDITKLDDGFKLAEGTVKMKLFKTLVEKMGCSERPIYYVGGNGSNFNMLPGRDFFRTHYDDLKIKFDYHVNFQVSEEEENNDFTIKIKLELDDKNLMDMNIIIKFTNEMSGRLTAKYKFDVSPEFNYLISKKELEESEPVEDEVEESDEVQEEEDREDNDPQELPEEYNKEE
jgi:hypothetical protein